MDMSTYEPIARALEHHGVRYSMFDDGKTRHPWRIDSRRAGLKGYTTAEARAYCQGLADKDNGPQPVGPSSVTAAIAADLAAHPLTD